MTARPRRRDSEDEEGERATEARDGESARGVEGDDGVGAAVLLEAGWKAVWAFENDFDGNESRILSCLDGRTVHFAADSRHCRSRE